MVNFKRYFLKFLLILVVLLLMPLFVLVISAFLFYLSYKSVSTDMYRSQKILSYSLNTMSVAKNVSLGIPIYINYSNVMYKAAYMFKEVLDMSEVGSSFASKIFSDDPYELLFYTDSVSAVLDRIHTDLGFLESDLNELNDPLGKIIKSYLSNSRLDIYKFKNKLYLLKIFSSRLSVLMGMDKPMKYLVIFQNSMELRPTGGFIGSFANITIDQGKMTEIVVSDVYSADGQLKGHVDPPEPIKQYLGEGGWYLRDSNWDPDFRESSKKIEWFLDKEMNTKVDGVISIDLQFVKKILDITGPLNLADFNKVINSNNLYESTQNEVESNFFPGSIKKASFMTSLSKELIAVIEQLPKNRYFAFAKVLYEALEERHIQVYLHDLNASDVMDKLNYSGNLEMNINCDMKCFYNRYSYIDANLGVNKSNLYIKRNQNLNMSVTKLGVDNQLLVTYENTAAQAVGKMGIYKTYSRLIVPIESDILGVRVYDDNGNYEDKKFDLSEVNGKKEVGFLLELLPGTTKRVQIVWNIKSSVLYNGGKLKLFVRKQAGTDNDELTVNVDKSELSLTGRASSVYTTTLDRDFELDLFFKP